MSEEFKSVFLVCLDHNDDMNYVVGRSYSMKNLSYCGEDPCQ